MAAYLIFEIEITDRDKFAEYVKEAKPTLDRAGAKILAIADNPDVIEGDWAPPRVVLIEFDSVAKATDWMNSDDYAPAKPLRHASANTNLVVVPGLG